jgi:hypothetical protein
MRKLVIWQGVAVCRNVNQAGKLWGAHYSDFVLYEITRYCSGGQIKDDMMGEVCRLHGRHRITCKMWPGKQLFRDLSVDARILF